jgi:hypothetical protein
LFGVIMLSQSEEEDIKAVVGKLKGEDKTTVQSYLFAKDKGWIWIRLKRGLRSISL